MYNYAIENFSPYSSELGVERGIEYLNISPKFMGGASINGDIK